MRRSSCLCALTAVLMIYTVCLVIRFFIKEVIPPDEFSDNVQKNKRESTNRNRDQEPTTERAVFLTADYCQRNESAANVSGFSSLPGHIQDFLFYRHCRHFPMLLDVPNKCGGLHKSAEVFLLLVIKSSPLNYDRREILRKTWAKERLQNGVWIRRVFLSGTTGTGFEKENLNKLLRLENREHNDILHWDFNDTFFNLTLKQILFLQWMDKNCRQARFLLNGDDDVFANTDNMVHFLQSLKNNNGDQHHFSGYLINNLGPVRDPKIKYYVPVQVQESDTFPPYCGGGGFLLSGYTAMVIYQMSHNITISPIDDVYMGMCLKQAGLVPESHFGIRTWGLEVPSKKVNAYDPCYYRELVLVHKFLPHQIYIIWHGLHEPDLNCDHI
ncbi:N-acetyllactosaminide beta-1,3-N-acetylglucosaminyltransferase 3-like [Esox lucius]|uniref:Hexosyltransferase n=1 Tax=Esox lucius TaxID=8010 RepID=A0AAY5KXZ5_ESOLU|nr:N-acetyllactosaminide beta-1,3-N-acetylglucosaminyltransferase 3-like [Esox lucius]XP_034152848.1 N-acetyllactosaminide beta-1,3-N-acetylglucosaminyltransferase 3-like [Esox lucius]XP_034152849.1 N-acetyllactosaminide beta-1,3-N-acetylglucosaminyltransferase 3-like [Esox lucius]